jgi:hypothetical protein
MKHLDASALRLLSQKIITSDFHTASEAVEWMGAMQAQDFLMSKWAIGLRFNEAELQKVDSYIDSGKILRIHLLRPTWHFVSSKDIYWMLELSAPRIIASLKRRHRELELPEPVITRTQIIIEKNLAGKKNMTRDQLAEKFNKEGIRTDANRLSHIMFCAELEGLVCSGPQSGNKQTYSLLSERVPEKNSLTKEEALAELAGRYFTSRFPATLEDFIWWSNIPVKDARIAVELISKSFATEKIGQNNYLFPLSFPGKPKGRLNVQLLPAYDEFLISYRDRSSSLAEVHNKRTISDNGIFFPIIVVNGQVSGVWKREMQKSRVVITARFYFDPGKEIINEFEKKCYIYGKFHDKETEIRYMNSSC